MNILVIGGGGRDHALCWKLSQSALVETLCCAPGNAGSAAVARCVDLPASNADAIIAFCADKRIDLVVIGPEQPLVDGLADALGRAGIRCFGPSAAAAQLEGSKAFTKALCDRAGIPTAAYQRFNAAAPAHAYIDAQGAPLVIKADGLAAGKGVIIATTVQDAHAAVDEMLAGAFGDAGAQLVIEDFLEGEEASFFVLCDGQTALPLATAQDHKRIGEGDTGPNTGGMGAYSPAPVMTEAMIARTMAEIIMPTITTMAAEGMPYVGVLYAGLMITADGPKLIEYNCRFGDPECQALMMRLKSDLLPALIAACDGQLAHVDLQWHADPALTVVMAAPGYPAQPRSGSVIGNLDAAGAADDVEIFHAGTRQEDGTVRAAGGRVLNVTAIGPSVAQAQAAAYAAVDAINWPEGYCRRDIGWRAIARERDAS